MLPERRRWAEYLWPVCVVCIGILGPHLIPHVPPSAPAVTVAETSSSSSAAAVPVRLRIARLEIDAPILPVGLTAARAMDIPRAASDVGWYIFSARPGEQGNAVLAGHLDAVGGKTGVFWNLKNLKQGDVVDVIHEDGTVTNFRVRGAEVYPYNDAPMEKIFGTSSGSSLNLITCTGTWNGTVYSNRLVVFTDKTDTPVISQR